MAEGPRVAHTCQSAMRYLCYNFRSLTPRPVAGSPPSRNAKESQQNMLMMKSKLRLMGAFAALFLVALAAGCRGFFPKPTLTSITISPTAPQVALGQTSQVQLWGTYDNGNRNQVTSGVSWSSSPQNIVSIDAGGNMTGLALGTTTVSGTAQGLPAATATATVFLTGVTQITVTPGSWSFSAQVGGSSPFVAEATVNGQTQPVNISTNGAVFTISPSTTGISCTAGTDAENCTATPSQVTAGTYTMTVSYPGTSITGPATITVSP